MPEAKSASSDLKTADEKKAGDGVSGKVAGNVEDEGGAFDGETRFEGTVLVEREIDGETVVVMTDKPRKGDKIQAHTLNDETGKLEVSTNDPTSAGAAPPPRR